MTAAITAAIQPFTVVGKGKPGGNCDISGKITKFYTIRKFLYHLINFMAAADDCCGVYESSVPGNAPPSHMNLLRKILIRLLNLITGPG